MVGSPFDSRVVVALVSAAVGAAIVGTAWLLTGGDGRPSPTGEVRLSFDPAPNRAAAVLRRSGAFGRAVASANHELKLPVDLEVKVVDETDAHSNGIDGPTYVPADRTVYFPWSFEEQSRRELETLPRFRALSESERRRTLLHAMTFALYHELAHGLLDVLDVPVVASQEAVADDFAAIFAIASSHGRAEIPLSIAKLQEADAENQGLPTLSRYADEHGFSRQRAINTLCLVYGSSPPRFAALVRTGALPRSRAQVCRFDYQNDLRSWRRLMGHWLTHAGGLRPLPLGD
jgi:hypothetical protein